MTPNQTDNVIAGYRNAMDAQQVVIAELRSEITRLQSGGCARNQGTTQFCAEAVEMRDEISILREQIESRDRHMNVCRGRTKCPADEVLAEWLKGFVRLRDPVVTGLVEALKSSNKWVVRVDDRQDDLPGSFIPFGTDPAGSVRRTRDAISAYEARVKEVVK